MPVPWEALIPFGLLTSMFAVTGTLFNTARRLHNDGKTPSLAHKYLWPDSSGVPTVNDLAIMQPPRYGIDGWEEMMMDRDKRLTGSIRGQSTNPIAPKSFATNSEWYTKQTR